jgi:hypothetical protein
LAIDAKAITTLQKHVEQGRVSPAERGFMVHFSFKLGARRALDFASFFGSKHSELAGLKQKHAELFGALQSSAVQEVDSRGRLPRTASPSRNRISRRTLLELKGPYHVHFRKIASMQTITIVMSQNLSKTDLESILEQWSESQGARVTPQGRLARRYKTEGASMHWHITGLKTGMGTVEVTHNPETRKLDVSVHDNRRGYWALSASRDLAKTLTIQRQ